MPTVPLPEPLSSSGAGTSVGDAAHPPNAVASLQQSGEGTAHVRASSPAALPNSESPSSQAMIADSQAPINTALASNLHPQLLSFYSTLRSTLKSSFPIAPPYTIQRLAELILNPTAHYRTLPSYLRALDRVISVFSTVDTFPLPVSDANNDSNSFLASSSASNLADDFNGAALTRIPWVRDSNSMVASSERPLASDLRTESTSVIDGPNGAGSMETVTVSINGIGSITRGANAFRATPSATMAEPLEQLHVPERAKESGLVPRQEAEADEERVHARGPEEIGEEDVGPQVPARTTHVFDAEAALGRPGEGEKVLTTEEKEINSESKDTDGDTAVKDANVNGAKEGGTDGELDDTSNIG